MLPLTEAEQRLLLRVARQALEERVGGDPSITSSSLPDTLCQPCGAFVTLHKAKRLRGCIGSIDLLAPLDETVRECAVAAALRDPRFEPVTPDELRALRIEISVLSPLVEASPDQVEVGRHGLLVSRGAQRGVLLPQVAVDWKWDRERFLEEACLKARLSADAWQSDAKLQTFTAQVFGEPSDLAFSSPHAA